VSDFFEHYPAPVEELVGIAAQLSRHARDTTSTVDDVKKDMGRAAGAVDGDLKTPMHQAPHPFELNGRNVAEGGRFASGVLMLFAQEVKNYNDGIDQLNAQIGDSAGVDATPDGALTARLQSLYAEQARLEADLDDDAALVAGMLERGPNATDMEFLRRHGHLLTVDPATDPAVRWALSRMPEGDPVAMRNWWAGLTLAQQAALIAYYPQRLGNADGLPAEVRDEANRLVMDLDYRRLTAKQDAGTLTPLEARALANIEHVRKQIAARDAHVDPLSGQPVPVQLYVYDPYAFGGDGRVAIATGNLDRADHVAIGVPGVGSSVQGLLAGTPHNIYDASRRASGDSVAVLDWMGYDSPNAQGWTQPGDIGGLFTDGMADDGAQRLAADVAGLQTIRSDDPTHLTVIGSSYGSTTAGIAAAEYGMRPDDLVFVGSPGIDADSAGDLTTGHDHTWVGSASQDPITGFGSATPNTDPAEADFGAQRFQAERVERHSGSPLDNHGGYDDPNSEGLYNIGAIVTGRYGDVHHAEHRHGYGDPDPETFRQPRQLHH